VGPDRIKAGRGIKVNRTGQLYVISADAQTAAAASGDTRWLPLGTVASTTSGAPDNAEFTLASFLDIPNGTPVRWVSGSTYVYAIVTAVDSGDETYLYRGAEIVAGDALEYDSMLLSTQIQLYIAGEYGSTTGSGKLWSASTQRFAWLLGPAQVCAFRMVHGNDATTSQATMNVGVDGTYVSANGVTLNGTDWVRNDAVDIVAPPATLLVYGSEVEIGCIVACVGATKAEDLSIEILVASE
jgi:hypothetical protein